MAWAFFLSVVVGRAKHLERGWENSSTFRILEEVPARLISRKLVDAKTKFTMFVHHILSWAERIINWLFLPIRKNMTFFVFMYLLGILCLFGHLRAVKSNYATIFLELYIICVLLTLLPEKVRKFVRGVLYVIFYLTALIDAFCFVKFQSPFTSSMLMVVQETNPQEATEFFQGYFDAGIFTSIFGGVLLLMFLHILFHSFTKKHPEIKQKTKNLASALFKNTTGHLRDSVIISTSVLLFAVSAYAVHMRVIPITFSKYKTFIPNSNVYIDPDRGFLMSVGRVLYALKINFYQDKQIDILKQTIDKSRVDDCQHTSSNIVLIIGESYNKHHSSLYGYEKKTTPYQEEMETSGSLVKFSDVITSWNLTTNVFKLIFSLQDVTHFNNWYERTLFPALFHKAGYYVTFLSNQFVINYHYCWEPFINDKIISEAQFDFRNDERHALDEGLIEDYERLDLSHPYNLFIFHLWGQHINYTERSSENMKKFRPADYNRPDLTVEEKQILADYDNATLYNDSIVNEIVKRFKGKDAIVIYMPDHGDECFDEGQKKFGRNHAPVEENFKIAKYEYEIPFWIYCSDTYKQKHPEIVQQINAAKDKRFMTDAMPHLMLYLAGIHCPDYQSALNLLSPDYDEFRPRLMCGKIDYDKLKAEKDKDYQKTLK